MKITPVRPYVVTDSVTEKVRLVKATSQAQARNFVARQQYAVRAASANEVIDLIDEGVAVETANDSEAE